MKKNKGITLIALVITIIVMLILVAVTITMTVNGGLFGYAGNAAKQTEEAKQEELDWATLSNNMSTNDLIAKYTTNKKEDLKTLQKAYIEGDETLRQEIEPNIINKQTGEDYQIIEYNNNIFIFSLEKNEEPENIVYTKVETLGNDEVIVLGNLGSYIRFKPTHGQTWSDWAENGDTDLDVRTCIFPNTVNITLKELINRMEEQGRKSIYIEVRITNNKTCSYPLVGGETVCSYNTVITPGILYEFNIK